MNVVPTIVHLTYGCKYGSYYGTFYLLNIDIVPNMVYIILIINVVPGHKCCTCYRVHNLL